MSVLSMVEILMCLLCLIAGSVLSAVSRVCGLDNKKSKDVSKLEQGCRYTVREIGVDNAMAHDHQEIDNSQNTGSYCNDSINGVQGILLL